MFEEWGEVYKLGVVGSCGRLVEFNSNDVIGLIFGREGRWMGLMGRGGGGRVFKEEC